MDYAATQQQITRWLQDQLATSRQNGYVVGVSGGIDSAVVSTLCALTEKPTLVISLPIHQAKSEHSRADKHIAWLTQTYPNVKTQNVDLTQIFDAYTEYLRSVDLKLEDDLVEANLRSRLRMTALYAFANAYRYLVVGTGNKVEDFGIGFFTKGGDGQVDISPIGDLMKSEVRALGSFLKISEDIVSATPTDGLWEDGRSDEDQIGASYDELEWAMLFWDGQKNLLNTRQKKVLTIYLNRYAANQHKMKMPPVCMIERK